MSIKDRLPAHNSEKSVPVQGMVPESLHALVLPHKKADGVTWNELIEACLRQYLAEKEAPKKAETA